MNLLTHLLPDPARLGDRGAAAALSAFREGLETNDQSGLSDEQKDLAGRIGQANAKIDAGTEIARTSELMTLAQFGAGSAGIAVANAFGDGHAKPALEGLMTARFLTDLVLSGNRHLIPADILRAENVSRDNLAWPAAAPVYRDLLDRAALALNRASAVRDGISSPALKKFFDREDARTARQIRKLAGKDPNSRAARLNTLDRIIISLTIRLHIRATP